jgi:hypothetical protein
MKMLLLALVAASAHLGQRFDLDCAGDSGEATHYRVDLTARRWCWDECMTTDQIQKVEASRITFKKEDTPSNDVWNWVDRTTGEWFQGMKSAEISVSSHGTCRAAPFSGFPKTKTKF